MNKYLPTGPERYILLFLLGVVIGLTLHVFGVV